MSETETKPPDYASFLDSLHTLPWCKQNDDVLVAVHTCTAEVLAVIGGHEVRVFPGNMIIKLNKSTVAAFQAKCDSQEAIPVLLVWKSNVLEIWFRTHKSREFPYDAWSDSAAAAYEKECVMIEANQFGENFSKYHAQHIANAKACPSMIPPM
jgi:hypothetical protein